MTQFHVKLASMNWILTLFFLAIVTSLAVGFYFLMKEGGTSSRNLFKALSWRVGLQITLILFLVLAYFMGWIEPHGGPLDRPPAAETTTPAS
ncbi:MAG: twin transmembrane helix small protein [Abyssibacter sp.]|uniref:twin transmembrane helix small protein n=1 Tax=Abyssibacter sp. TaxID=2320200 RepID=UPI002EBB28A4|nr:twin transmembrane helix small protein [Pseudomonadota bacterium]